MRYDAFEKVLFQLFVLRDSNWLPKQGNLFIALPMRRDQLQELLGLNDLNRLRSLKVGTFNTQSKD